MRRTFVSAVVVFLAFGSVTLAQGSVPPFDAKSLRPYRHAGSASMTGTLEVAVAGDDKPMVGSGMRVIAIPDSAYSKWWIASTDAALAAQTGPVADPPDDPKLRPYERTTQTDYAGNFRFDGLPAGSYRVRGRVDARFDQTIAIPHQATTMDVNGNPIVSSEITTKTYHNRSEFWLESGLVRLARNDSRAISLHVAARRNIYGRR